MGLSCVSVDKTTPAVLGNVTVTLGFQAAFVFIQICGLTSDTQAADGILGIGMGISTTQRRAACAACLNGDSGNSGYSAWDNNHIIALINTAGTPIVVADLTAIGSTTITLNFSSVTASAFKYNVWAIGGSDITGSDFTAITAPASTGNQTYSGLSGTPVVVFFLGSSLTTDSTARSSSECALSLGWMTGAGTQGAVSLWTANATADAYSSQLTDHCLSHITSAGTFNHKAKFVSVANGNFVLNWDAATTQFVYGAFVLYGTLQVATFSNTSPLITGTQANSLSFTPVGALVQSYGEAASTAVQTGISHSVGVSDGTTQRCSVFIAADGAGSGKFNSQTGTSTIAGKNLQDWTPGASPTKTAEAAESSFTGGVTENFGTVNASLGMQYIGLAFGPAVAASTTPGIATAHGDGVAQSGLVGASTPMFRVGQAVCRSRMF